ncbi:MAG TPA: prepilin-type N-terminal cleavage/methylation domain-containing protein [Verrucomicrobiae bacterium]|nr:prepilin-type N-terminal cleavage/methylation domain-containing protein [Verrucomicrobiae bacterium]
MNPVDRTKPNSLAFTLVEIMVVVAIIGVVMLIAVPAFIKPRKQSQGQRIVNDARQLDAAINQWAVEKGKQDGDKVNTTQAASYLKDGWIAKDILGNSYKIGTVGTNQVQIAAKTKKALAKCGVDWGPY